MESFVQIGKQKIGRQFPPYVVAELSGNHNGSLERALNLVDLAAETGVQAVKLQTYTADSMTLDIKTGPYLIQDPKSLWNGRTLYDLYKEAATPYEWHEKIMARCKKHGMDCFSSPFDEKGVDFLESLDVTCYKIASFELTDIPLLKRVAKTKKPVILSTGMASLAEMTEAVDTLRGGGANEIILLKCTSTYPATPENTNLTTIPLLRDVFKTEVGLSDHTMGVGVSIASVALGATFIEKHFTTSRKEGGVDSAFSMEPHEMKLLVEEARKAWQGLGKAFIGPAEAEIKSKIFRRGLVITKDLEAGAVLSKENVRALRPVVGIEPKFLDAVIGKKLKRSCTKGTGVTWDLI